MDQDGQDQNQAGAAPPPQEAPPQSNDAAPEQSSEPQSAEPVGDASSPQDGEEAAAVSPPPAETEAAAEETPAADPEVKQRDESPPAESTTAPADGGGKEAPRSEEPQTGKPPAAEEGARGMMARDEDIAWGLLAQAERRDRGDLERTAHNDAASKRKAAAKAHQAAESEFAQGLAEVEREAAKERRAKDKAVREAAREREKENRALYTARLVVERKRAETLRQLHRDTAVKRADEVDAVRKEEVRKAREARAANFSTRVKNNDASRQHATPDPKRTTGGVSPVRGAATPAPVFSPSRRIVDEAVEEAARRQAERQNRAIIEARERRNRELVRAEQREREAAQRREEEALRAAAAARAAEAMHQMSEQQKAEAARLDHLVRENRRRRELSPLKDDPSPVKPSMSPREEVDNTMAAVNRVVEERLANRRREQERRKAEIAARDRQLLADIESAKKLEAVELAADREHVNTLRAADERRRARLRQWREERTTAANEAVSQLKKQCAQDAAGAVEDTTQARRERLLETERLHQVHLLTKQQAAAAKAADLLRQEELAAERRAARLAAQRESEAAAAAAREEAERLRLKRVANQQRFTVDRKLSGQEKELRTEAFYKGFAPPPKAPTVRAPKKFSESEARRAAVAPYNEVAAIAPGGSVYDSKVDADLAAADRSLKQIRKEARK